jgi:molecular chaperone DnaK
VQVSFDIDANGLLQVSATDRTTGRQQSVTIQGGSNLSEEEIEKLLAEAEQKAAEDRRKRSEIDRRNRAQTLVAQAERRLRDAALELGPYGAERQQRGVELALRDVQDLLAGGDTAELELAVSQLQEALFGLNRRLMSERRAEGGPLQGIRNTLGSLKDELFAEDDWDEWDSPRRGDWESPRRSDPWSTPARGNGGTPYAPPPYTRPTYGPDGYEPRRLGREDERRDLYGTPSPPAPERFLDEGYGRSPAPIPRGPQDPYEESRRPVPSVNDDPWSDDEAP